MSHTPGAQDSRAVLLRRMALQLEGGTPGGARGGSLLGSISDFCRRTGMAESTFGRRAVNDGKFVARLRDGARVTPETLTRVNDFITKHGGSRAGGSPPEPKPLPPARAPQPAPAPPQKAAPDNHFPLFHHPANDLPSLHNCPEEALIS